MDIGLETLFDLTPVALMTFGIVWAISLWRPNLGTKDKFALSVVVAFIISFIPADLGNFIVNKVKEAVGVATGLTGFYQMFAKLAERIAKA